MRTPAMALPLIAVLPLVSSSFDPNIVANCQSCTPATQPDCMTLLETANAESDSFDIVFAGEVACGDLEFAFECVLLKNPVYPEGYLAHYFGDNATSIEQCETYADFFDTMKCNTECVEAGNDVQEGAEEAICEQCTEDTVSACYNFLGYSTTDDTMSCDTKQLALDCLTTNFTKYPEGYLAYMATQRGSSSDCESVAAAYSTDDCSLRCSACPNTCLFDTCDAWVQKGINTCPGLEVMGCDCTGCQLCDVTTHSPDSDSGDWVLRTTTQCGRGELGDNELPLGAGGNNYDIVDNENFFVSDCKATCEASDVCGGFALEYGTQQTCWYVADTTLNVVDDVATESCYTYVGRGDAAQYSVEWCEICSATTVSYCMSYMQLAAHNSSTSCSDLSTGMACLNDNYWSSQPSGSCDQLLSQLSTFSCGLSCPATCMATCNYQSCDDIISYTDVLSCPLIENSWGCDCRGCVCNGNSAALTALGYSAVVGTPCAFSDFGANTNRASIASIGTTFMKSATVDDCAAVCNGDAGCGGFSYDIIAQECTFVVDSSQLSTTSGEYMCLTRTGGTVTTTTASSSTTTTSDWSYDNSGTDDGPDVAVIGGVIGGVVVVGAIVGIIVWRVKASNEAAPGFSPQANKRPTTYAAPKTPGSTRRDNLDAIDEDHQIDQDKFEL